MGCGCGLHSEIGRIGRLSSQRGRPRRRSTGLLGVALRGCGLLSGPLGGLLRKLGREDSLRGGVVGVATLFLGDQVRGDHLARQLSDGRGFGVTRTGDELPIAQEVCDGLRIVGAIRQRRIQCGLRRRDDARRTRGGEHICRCPVVDDLGVVLADQQELRHRAGVLRVQRLVRLALHRRRSRVRQHERRRAVVDLPGVLPSLRDERSKLVGVVRREHGLRLLADSTSTRKAQAQRDEAVVLGDGLMLPRGDEILDALAAFEQRLPRGRLDRGPPIGELRDHSGRVL